ncbi:hypothetical protein [Nocardioides sp.]|uniref:OB-fold protein n=1 Tax=Nocardioides sp. TaxID=35761 RepID=UPI0026271EBF|nr:hypothetical protein [Nocardioides sp.]MCW2738621.1 hypothetical protein [Nocardioides sp.]
MKRAAIALLIAALGFVAAGCDVPEDSAESGKSKKSNSKPVRVEAKKILKQFDDNEAAADGQYKGKTLQIAGVVDKIDTELFDDDEYVVNVGAGSDFEFVTVNCDDQASKDVASLKKGQKITVVGDFEDGGDLGVELENCKIK